MSVENVLMQQLQDDGSYNQLYPKTNVYSKSETLTNETSQMFRIKDGTPEDIFKWLRKYNQYWWEKSQFTITHYEQIQTNITEDIYLNGSNDSTPSSYFVWCSKSINVDNNGKMSPANGQALIISADNTNATQLKNLAPCYLFIGRAKGSDNQPKTAVYYLPSGSTAGNRTNYTINGNTRYYIGLSASASVKAQLVTQKQVTGQTMSTVLISSKEKDAYSNDGEVSSKSIEKGSSFTFDFSSSSQYSTIQVTILNNVSINNSTGKITYNTGDSGTLNYRTNFFYTNSCKGQYIKFSTSDISSSYYGIQDNNSDLIFYVPSNGSLTTSQTKDNPNSTTYYYHTKFTVQPVYVKETQLRDGNYTLIGNPFESFEYNSKIQMGSYIGTGTFGESNKSSLTFPFVPKMVQIARASTSYNMDENGRIFYIGQPGQTGSSSYGKAFSVENNTFYYYNSKQASYQCNVTNETYYYIGIGE